MPDQTMAAMSVVASINGKLAVELMNDYLNETRSVTRLIQPVGAGIFFVALLLWGAASFSRAEGSLAHFTASLATLCAFSFAAGAWGMNSSEKKSSEKWLGLALGTLLGLVIFHLLPESVESIGLAKTSLFLAAGWAALWMESLVRGGSQSCCDEEARIPCWSMIAGLVFCSIDDGIVLALCYHTDHRNMTWLALLLHKLFESFAVAGLLRIWLKDRRSALAALSGLCALLLVGGLATYGVLSASGEAARGVLPAVASGILLFAVWSHLAPHVLKAWGLGRSSARDPGARTYVPEAFKECVLGFAVMGAASLLH